MSQVTSVVYVAPGKVGGVLTNLNNLRSAVDAGRYSQHSVLTYNEVDRDVRFEGPMQSGTHTRFTHRLPLENLHSVLAKLQRMLPAGRGVLVASDWIELAAVRRYGTARLVIQVLHGDFDYYYDLALRHEADVDIFVACSREVADKLRARLPNRSDDVKYVPYGVPIPKARRAARSGPLRLVFAGRLDQPQKRVFDLPEIDRALGANGVEVEWTIIGDGPDGDALRARWRNNRIRWTGVLSNQETVQLMARQDVLILTSRSEGLPLSLLEGMAVGLVPVVTDLASGIRDVVRNGDTGRRVGVGDIEDFSNVIAGLDRDRSSLELMSASARGLVRAEYCIARQAANYQDLFSRCNLATRPKRGGAPLPYGSRLDRSWIPNRVVRFIRERRRPDLAAQLSSSFAART